MAKNLATFAAVLLAGCSMAGAAAWADDGGRSPPTHWGQYPTAASAFGVKARFVAGGSGTALAAEPLARGENDGFHRGMDNRGSLIETLAVASGGQQVATLQISATHLLTLAKSGGDGRHLNPAASGAIGSVQITLTAYPPPPTGPMPAPLLSVVASNLAWSANYTQMRPLPPTVMGQASDATTTMTITGSLVNADTINITGLLLPNGITDITPLGGGAVEIALNRQTTDGQVVCTSTCAFVANDISVAALSIRLDQVMIGGQSVSGTITVGGAKAGILLDAPIERPMPPMPPVPPVPED